MKELAWGAAGGIAAGLVTWFVASRLLDKQLSQGSTELSAGLQQGRTELEAKLAQGRSELTTRIRSEVQSQVPPVVRRELESTLARYNITPTTGRQISTVLSYADRMGII